MIKTTLTYSANILLVEDNPNDVELTMHMLGKSGFAGDVKVVRDGVQALDYLRGVGAYEGVDLYRYPQLVLLDIKLPRMNGIDVLRQMKSHSELKKLVVVMLTASSEDSDISTCYELGANGYVVKPVEYDDFRKVIERIGVYWLQTNVPPFPY